MDNVFFDNPPVLQGNEQTQLQQLSGYLFTMSQKLNEAMMAVATQEAEAQEQQAGAGGQAEEQKNQEYATLKSMIIKTAQIVRTEMEEIATALHGETEAISEDLGTLETTLDATIRATAEGVLQDYNYEETVRDTQTNTFYRNQVSQYIFTGLLNDNPVEYGIAIGEGVTAYDPDTGEAYLNQNAKVATFTMNKLAFWQGTAQLAYFSSGKFFITDGEITNTLQIGNFKWKAMTGGSMALLGPSMGSI